MIPIYFHLLFNILLNPVHICTIIVHQFLLVVKVFFVSLLTQRKKNVKKKPVKADTTTITNQHGATMNAIHHPQQRTGFTIAKLLINGEFVESKTSHWQDIVNPATQEVLGQVPFATTEEVNAAIAAAQNAFASWRQTPIQTRMRIMLKLQDLIRTNLKSIAQVLTAEQGKTLADAEGDIQRGLEVVEHACSVGSLQMGEYIEGVARGVVISTLQPPLGGCAGITPFNFPAMIPLWMFPMAIVCGNTFVLKPSEQDPLSTMMLVELAIQAGVPAGVLNVVHGGKEV